MIFDILQFCGGIIISLGNIFQVIQVIKTKSVRDLNFKTFLSIFAGISLMEAYAINLVVNGSGYMFLVTNTMSLAIIGVLCVLIFIYRERKK
jgi:MtN3 and saliva related transmembrane protein